MVSVLCFSRSRRLFSWRIRLSRRTTSLLSRVMSLRSVLMVSFWSGDCSRAVCRRRVSAGRGPTAPSRASGTVRALRSRATSLRSASILLLSFDPMPASERSVSRRATSACKEGTSRAARRASFVSSTASLNLPRQALNRDFHAPASLREATSAQRSSSARASPASARARSRSARARSRSYSERKSRSVGPGTDTGHDRTTPLPSTSVRSVPKSSSRTAMRSTITHGKRRYQPPCGTSIRWG